ncbi:MAG: class I SAM-dependent methyltransferase, partial [Bdellovibrionales bacterium]|nr:class I SAM-dependent methyltransferase [Bdellovibrionales bacterium]
MENWIQNLFQDPTLLKMGHAQRLDDLNLGLGWIYYGLVRLVKPTTIVAIGSWRGFAPLVLGKGMKDNLEEGKLIFIDPSMVDGFWKDAERVKKHFEQFEITNIEHFCSTTQNFINTEAYRNLKEVQLLFVDGYHTRDQAKFDYEAFAHLIPEQGCILFHDSTTAQVS